MIGIAFTSALVGGFGGSLIASGISTGSTTRIAIGAGILLAQAAVLWFLWVTA